MDGVLCVQKTIHKVQPRLLLDVVDALGGEEPTLRIIIEMRKENARSMDLLQGQKGARQKIDLVIHISRRRKRKEGKRECTEEDR